VTFNEKKPSVKYVEVAAKLWPVKFELSNNKCSEIVIMRAGVVEEKFLVDVPGHPAYFSNGVSRISVIGGLMYYYTWKNSTAEIKYFLSNDASKLDIKNIDEATVKLNAYLIETFNNQTGARTDLVADQNAAIEKEKIVHSLKGKDIKKIEFVWLTPSSEIGLQCKVKYGIKATDAKGVEYKTISLGGKTPYEDFDIAVIGALPGDDAFTVESTCQTIKGDKVQVVVKNKFNPTVQTTSSIPFSYSTPVSISYRGDNGCEKAMYRTSGYGGGKGSDLEVFATSKNNFILVEIKKANTGEILHQIKVKPNTTINIDVSGGDGCSGTSSTSSNGGKGGNGGDGGNVIIYQTAGLTGCSLVVKNSGGNGAAGGKGASINQNGMSGTNGDNGAKSELVGVFSLNF
jgi:hypothetical protein